MDISLLAASFQTFATVFLGIVLEAMPFLLLGVLLSAVVQVLLREEILRRWVPQGRVGGAIAGTLLGLVFPMCECGAVPFTRRLLRKGVPLQVGVPFILASPVVNPVVIASTFIAFGGRFDIVAWRVGLTILVAAFVGLLLSFHPCPADLLAPAVGGPAPSLATGILARAPAPPAPDPVHFTPSAAWLHAGPERTPAVGLLVAAAVGTKQVDPGGDAESGIRYQASGTHTLTQNSTLKTQNSESWRHKLGDILVHAADETFDMGRYLVIGGALAAGLQAFVPQSTLLSIGQGPVASVIVMMLLAALLSICSTVDAFVALGFAGTFSTGALLSFLVFGPMVDIKSTLMFASTFRRRVVALMLILIAQAVFLLGVAINLNLY